MTKLVREGKKWKLIESENVKLPKNVKISNNFKIIRVGKYTFDFQKLDVRDATIKILTSVPSDEDASVFIDKKVASKILDYLEYI